MQYSLPLGIGYAAYASSIFLKALYAHVMTTNDFIKITQENILNRKYGFHERPKNSLFHKGTEYWMKNNISSKI